MKIKIILALFSALVIFGVNYAWASSIAWNFLNPCSDSGAPDQFFGVTFTATDPTLVNGGQDTINVKVNSTSNPNGITLRLNEDPGDTGTFTNTNMIFTNGVQQYAIGSKQTVGFQLTAQPTDPNVQDKFISGPSAADGIWAISTSDLVGTYINVTETGDNTQIFTGKLTLVSGSSINGSALHVSPGDIVSIIRLDFSSEHSNELVVPNPNLAVGALPVQNGDTVTVSYDGSRDDTVYGGPCGGPGGGGGGLIHSSLVIDAIAAVGGSPYVVSPPSFGGSFSDGLTLTQGNAKTTFDTSKFNQEIPNQVMVKGEPTNMKFKTYEAYKKDGVIGMTLYFIPRGKDLNMDVGNSIASIEWKNGKPVDVDDSSHILSDVKATSDNDGKFQYTQFSFTPTKSYDKMSFLVRAWNDHHYTRTMRVHDAVDVLQPPKTLPPGVVKYENFADLQDALYKDKFYKPAILAHIHGTNAVFPDLQGKVYWLYDTNEHSVTLVISDSEDNELFEHKGLLQPYEVEKKGDYGFMSFTTVQLNRQNVDQIQKALKSEEEKAKDTLLDMKVIRTSKW